MLVLQMHTSPKHLAHAIQLGNVYQSRSEFHIHLPIRHLPPGTQTVWRSHSLCLSFLWTPWWVRKKTITGEEAWKCFQRLWFPQNGTNRDPVTTLAPFPTLFLWKIELQLYPIFKNKHISIILPQNKSSLKLVVRSTHLLWPIWLSLCCSHSGQCWLGRGVTRGH